MAYIRNLLDHQHGWLLMFPLARQQGFSIIEIAIVMVIMSVLVAMALPGFSEWVANQKVRTAAESMLDGLQVARAEAIRRNVYTQFVLTTASGWEAIAITAPSPAVGMGCSETGKLETRSAAEGSSSVTVAITSPTATRITFTPMGWTLRDLIDCTGNDPIQQIDLAAPGSPRPLRIVINPGGGGIRLCDPALPAGDPRGCTL